VNAEQQLLMERALHQLENARNNLIDAVCVGSKVDGLIEADNDTYNAIKHLRTNLLDYPYKFDCTHA